jgi:DNA-binding YbaB/EbfC family protein
MGELLRQAQAMQEQLMAAQAEAAEQVVEGQAGGGVVKVQVTGGMEFRSVTISPDAVDPDDVEMLEDLVLAAIHDATGKVQELQQGALGSLGMGNLGIGGPDAGGLGGLLGG